LRLHQIQRHINMLIPQRVCANSNGTCPPQRGMQPLGIEIISSSPRHLTTLNFFYLHLFFQPLCNLHNEIAFFFILLQICMQNTSICIIQPHAYNCNTSLLQWQKFFVTNCHTKHLGIYDWIHANLKHIRKNL
jgi:hypothetical protein